MRSRRVVVPVGGRVKIADGPISNLLLTANGPVFLGGESVTAANGFRWEGGDLRPLSIPLLVLDRLWATAGSTGIIVSVLEPGVL